MERRSDRESLNVLRLSEKEHAWMWDLFNSAKYRRQTA
jgi:hypothetical protein